MHDDMDWIGFDSIGERLLRLFYVSYFLLLLHYYFIQNQQQSYKINKTVETHYLKRKTMLKNWKEIIYIGIIFYENIFSRKKENKVFFPFGFPFNCS